MKTSVLILGVLAAIGCGSVTAKSTDDDGGSGGAASTGGKIGVESDAGGEGGSSSATGGAVSATGGSGGVPPGTGGAQATGGAVAGTGGASGNSGAGGTAGGAGTDPISPGTTCDGWTPTGCAPCPGAMKCSACNPPSWSTARTACYATDNSGGQFVATTTCARCATL